MLLHSDLKNIKGVEAHEICHKRGHVDLSYEGDFHYKKAEEVIVNRGYEITEGPPPPKQGNNLMDYVEMGLIAVIFIVIAWILGELHLYQYFPQIGDDASVVVALLLGLVASVSTCLALVGGIVISFGSTYKIDPDRKHPFLAHVKPHLLFHVGRFGAFVLLGGLLGVVGSFFNFSLGFTSYLTFAIAIVMFYIGLQILGIVPSITKLGFHMPKRFSSKVGALQEAEHAAAPFVLGALTFFLPCGFTQSVQLVAIASGDFMIGAMLMGAFALGTLPVLLGIGVGSSYAKDVEAKLFKKFVGVLIILFALYSFNNGMRLLGVGVDFSSSSGETEVTVTDDGYQEVYMTADWTFEPNEFVVQKDVPVRWIIDGKNISGCIASIVIPDLDLEFDLEKGENIIEFVPTEVGEMDFSCWMGMVGGSFTVVE